MEPLLFILAGVAVMLLAALAIAWSRRRKTALPPEQPFFQRGADADQPSPSDATAGTVADGGGRQPVTAASGALVGAATGPSTGDLGSSTSLAARSTLRSSRPALAERPGTVRFWRLFDGDTDVDEGAGPVCFAVDGVTVDGVIDLVTMDFEQRGFVVRPQSADRIRAHRGPVVLQATFRGVHTDLTWRDGVYRGTPQPFVLVEIEVPPKDPPTPMSPTVGVN